MRLVSSLSHTFTHYLSWKLWTLLGEHVKISFIILTSFRAGTIYFFGLEFRNQYREKPEKRKNIQIHVHYILNFLKNINKYMKENNVQNVLSNELKKH